MTEDVRRELLILRHGKSSWNSDAQTDFDRPLATRGQKDAPRMGAWMAERNLVPDLVVSSPAVRALQTSHAAVDGMGEDGRGEEGAAITLDERIYGATVGTLLDVLADVPADVRRVMIVGHNPGFEDLVLWLASTEPTLSPSGKLMPTCALAHLQFATTSGSWADLAPRTARVLNLMRPKELGD